MKTYLLILLMILPVFALAQDRDVRVRSLKQPSSQLMGYSNLDNSLIPIAAGIVQSPQGYALTTHDLIPAESLIGLYGQSLIINGVQKALLQNQGAEIVVEAHTWPVGWLKIEMMTFRLPPGVRGEVLVKTLGRDASNTVRFFVE